MRAHTRLLKGLAFIVLLLLVLSALAVWFYRPTASAAVPEWSAQTTTTNAPALAKGRRAETYNLLVVGRDRASTATDVMALLSFDIPGQTATLLQLPRDTLVCTNGSKKKLNAVFAEERLRAKREGKNDTEADAFALGSLRTLLSESFCVAIDYQALVYLDGFVQLVDAIGGVTVDIPFPMHYDDPAQNLHIHLDAGTRHLNGAEAEGFVRFRKGNNGTGYPMGDLDRLDTQKSFARAVLARFQETAATVRIPALMRLVLQSVKSDLTLSDCVYFAKHAAALSPEQLSLYTLPGRTAGNDYVILRAETLDLLNRHFNVYTAEIPKAAFDPAHIFADTANTR